jgi:hypothetical protein
MKIKVPEINIREELRAFVDSLSKKQLDGIREEFLDGFADAYRVDRSDANAAYIGFLEGCMLDWYDEIYEMLGGYVAGLKTGAAYRERMDGQD